MEKEHITLEVSPLRLFLFVFLANALVIFFYVIVLVVGFVCIHTWEDFLTVSYCEERLNAEV